MTMLSYSSKTYRNIYLNLDNHIINTIAKQLSNKRLLREKHKMLHYRIKKIINDEVILCMCTCYYFVIL